MTRKKRVHKESQVRKRKRNTLLLGIAAVIVVGFFLGSFIANYEEELPEYGSDVHLLLTEQELAEEVKEFKTAIERDPEDYHSHSGLGWVYIQQKEYDHALSTFHLMESKFDDDFRISLGEGWSHYRLQEYTKAKRAFNRALTFIERDIPEPTELVSLYTGLGFLEHKLGGDASSWFVLGTQQGVHNILPYVGLTMIYHAKGEEDAASRYGEGVRLYFEVPQLVRGLNTVFVTCMEGKRYNPPTITSCAEKI